MPKNCLFRKAQGNASGLFLYLSIFKIIVVFLIALKESQHTFYSIIRNSQTYTHMTCYVYVMETVHIIATLSHLGHLSPSSRIPSALWLTLSRSLKELFLEITRSECSGADPRQVFIRTLSFWRSQDAPGSSCTFLVPEDRISGSFLWDTFRDHSCSLTPTAHFLHRQY